MHFYLTRRQFAVATGALFATAANSRVAGAAVEDDAVSRTLRDIEARLNARLGAVIFDKESGTRWTHRADERFPMNSTFKAFACAAVLARVDADKEVLGRSLVIRKSDLVNYAPVTEKRVGKEMTLAELCEAASTMSDNTAANLILDSLGGPKGWTQFMHSIGDDISRLDRNEPGLTEGTPGDPRDTTTPNAIVKSLETLVFGDVLSPASREQFLAWLLGNKVGQPMLRAGIPTDWRIGDRTGAGGHGSRGIVAVMWPPKRKPVVAAIYLTETTASMDERNAAFAEIGRAIKKAITG